MLKGTVIIKEGEIGVVHIKTTTELFEELRQE